MTDTTRTWRPAIGGVRAAFVFLTRVPLGNAHLDSAEWSWAPAHFPLVGLVVGVMLAGAYLALSPLGAVADAVFVLAASLLVTGAMHEDGLADTSDALGGARDREGILRILKDSRVGSYGACALFVSLAGRAALLARLGDRAPAALVLVGCAARVGPVWLLARLPYVSGAAGKSRDVAAAGVQQAITATLWWILAAAAAVLTGAAAPARVLAVTAAMAAVTALTGWRYVRRAGGATGDFLGATEQLCELAGYAALAWSTS